MIFAENLVKSILDKHSVVCMGLDPRLEKDGEIPNFLVEDLEEPNEIILEFNKSLIDETFDLIPVIKPQIAFYEKYDAINALKQTIKYAHKKDLLVILDSKRNDIGSTSKAYAESTFEVYQADACTLNGYLGIDSIKPYVDNYSNKGLFILVKTSNPSSREFQDLFSSKILDLNEDIIETYVKDLKLERNFIQMARLIKRWSQDLPVYMNYSNLGAVVGATYPKQLKAIRKIIPSSFFLIPGYGAQGATAEDLVSAFDHNGLGGIVNSSRGIMFAYARFSQFSPSEYAKAARYEVKRMNKSINKQLKTLHWNK